MRPLVASMLFLAACCAPGTPAPSVATIDFDPLVKVYANEEGYGSGFVIRSRQIEGDTWVNLIITAKHVAKEAEASYPQINGHKATVVSLHPELDVALISMVTHHPMQVVEMRTDRVQTGETLFALGYSGGDDFPWASRSIASGYNRGGFAAPGDSGGMVTDEFGRVVGVIMQVDLVGTKYGVHLVFHHLEFVPVVNLQDWLDSVLP